MYKILLDTTERYQNKVVLVKCSKDEEKTVDEIEGDIDVVASIDDILKKNKVDISEIDEFVPNVGPGSFTGIKTGVTVANVLNWALGKRKGEEPFKPDYGADPNIDKSNKFLDA